jgi:hypothetical protein
VSIHRVRAVLGVDRFKIPALLSQSKNIYNAMSADKATYAAPNPPLATLLAQIQALDTAQQAVKARTPGAAAARDAKRDVLFASLESEQAYVQSLGDASPDRAPAIVTGAAMAIARAPSASKPVVDVKLGTLPGTATLRANASVLVGKGVSKRPTFNWQLSADGGKTWSMAPSTPLAKTVIENLAPMTTYLFRVSATVANVAGEWSQPVSILVH